MIPVKRELQQALCYEDLCELRRIFNEGANLRMEQHCRINEALKEAIGRAAQFFPNDLVHLRNAVSKRKQQAAE